MNPVLQSCQLVLRLVCDLIAGVRLLGCTDGRSQASDFVHTKAATQRLKVALRLVEAYLRRVLLVMALALEPTLIDTPQKLARSKDGPSDGPSDGPNNGPSDASSACTFAGQLERKSRATGAPFQVFVNVPALPEEILAKLRQGDFGAPVAPQERAPLDPIFIGRFKTRLDTLAKIAADPLPHARRLAFYLARTRPGPMLEPDRHLRVSSSLGPLRKLWRTETSATFDAMGMQIRPKSRARPPPLPPHRRHPPPYLAVGG